MFRIIVPCGPVARVRLREVYVCVFMCVCVSGVAHATLGHPLNTPLGGGGGGGGGERGLVLTKRSVGLGRNAQEKGNISVWG